ncbi:MAG: hypothetical protein ABFC96_01120 [Thermoguttaceae bacterium]
MNNFVRGGASIYLRALRSQFRAEMEQLRDRLDAAATESERADLQRQLKRLKDEYRGKRGAIDRSLF